MKKKNEKSVKNKPNKNIVKKKKNNVKSVIDSPFSLEWPPIDFGKYSQVVSCLKQSFCDYLTVIKKEHNASAATTESAVPRDIKNYTKKLLSKSKSSHIIFGYNEVMRGLEKGKIKSVLVNNDTKPNMIIKSFIPICNLRSIPLIPIKNLPEIFSNEIRIKSTVAVGFTSPACEVGGPFHDLYNKCCTALGFDDSREDLLDSKEISDDSVKNITNRKQANYNKNMILSHHLKRESKKVRVFEPSKKESEFDTTDLSFIKFGTTDPPEALVNNSKKFNEKEVPHFNPLVENSKTFTPEPDALSFFIDVGNELEIKEFKQEKDTDDKQVKRSKRPFSTARYFNALSNSPDQNGSKRKSHYIEAKIKKIKPNLERRS